MLSNLEIQNSEPYILDFKGLVSHHISTFALIGVIDGTHIPVISSSKLIQHTCRHGYISENVVAIYLWLLYEIHIFCRGMEGISTWHKILQWCNIKIWWQVFVSSSRCTYLHFLQVHMYTTTGLCLFAVCQGHTAKAGLHSAKCLPSVTHGKHLTANNGRPIYIILKWFRQNILVMVHEQDLQNLLWVQAYVITLTSWTWISFFGSLYSNTQNTSSLIARNFIKQIKSLNIVKL